MPGDFIQGIAGGGLSAAVIGALGVLIKLAMDKKMRTPADQQSETMNVFAILSKTIEDNRTDRAALEGTIRDLRSYAEKADSDARQDQELIRSLHARIGELETIIRVKDRRIDELESELSKHAKRLGEGSRDSFGQTVI
jgi:chromosome segregation ATPase